MPASTARLLARLTDTQKSLALVRSTEDQTIASTRAAEDAARAKARADFDAQLAEDIAYVSLLPEVPLPTIPVGPSATQAL